MFELSKRIPDSDALEQLVIDQLPSLTAQVNDKVGHLEEEYKRVSKRRRYAGAFVGAVVLMFVFAEFIIDLPPSVGLGDFSSLLLGIIYIPLMAVLGYVAWRLYRDPTNVTLRFNQGINRFLFPEIAKLFGVTGQVVESTPELQETPVIYPKNFWTKDRIQSSMKQIVSPQQKQVLALLEHSELITEPRNRVSVDDMMHMTVENQTLFLSELSVKHVTGSGKNRRTKKIFKGYFLSLDLTKSLAGKTFVSSEGDKKGFGHKSFWKNLRGTGAQETILEWNDFESLLHVAATDQTEARYILTPNFMAELHDWWLEHKNNIRLSFLDNRMYILFPDSGIQLSKTVPAITQAHISKYVLSIAQPLLHVLHLVEKIKI